MEHIQSDFKELVKILNARRAPGRPPIPYKLRWARMGNAARAALTSGASDPVRTGIAGADMLATNSSSEAPPSAQQQQQQRQQQQQVQTLAAQRAQTAAGTPQGTPAATRNSSSGSGSVSGVPASGTSAHAGSANQTLLFDADPRVIRAQPARRLQQAAGAQQQQPGGSAAAQAAQRMPAQAQGTGALAASGSASDAGHVTAGAGRVANGTQVPTPGGASNARAASAAAGQTRAQQAQVQRVSSHLPLYQRCGPACFEGIERYYAKDFAALGYPTRSARQP